MKHRNITVLVAEDDSNDQFFIQRGFERAGAELKLQFVSSGKEAIAYLSGTGKFADRTEYEYPCYILTDLKMPDGDGFSVLEFLGSRPEFAVVPMVVLSASEDLDDIKKSYMLGASAYLTKSSDLEELDRSLKVMVEFWTACHVPQVDDSGKRLVTDSRGKLGERFAQ